MNALLILNPRAGSLLNDAPDPPNAIRLHDAFAAGGIDVSLHSLAGDELDAVVDKALTRRVDAVFVGGGDGTISAAAARLVGSGTPLGVLPLGTLNHFARDLGIPAAWREAVAALTRARVQTVDVGEVNGRVFINNCSIGSYAEAVRRRDALRRQHGHGKWRAMALAALGVFRDLKRLRLEVEFDGTRFNTRTPFLLVANNRYAGHVLDASLRPQLDEGRLWLYSTRAKGRADLLRLIWQTLVRNLDEADALDFHPATHARITSPLPRLPIAADGEVLNLEPPFRFRIRARALHVLVPPLPPPS